MIRTNVDIILATTSAIRIQMLNDCNIRFRTIPHRFDEKILQTQKISPRETASRLSLEKALSLGDFYPDSLILGCDQTLEFENRLLTKPGTREKNIYQLLEMSGKSHKLYSALSATIGKNCLFCICDEVELTMRTLSLAQIQTYVDQEGAFNCCGGYKLEGMGKHLFQKIRGDHDTILGLPLIPLLNFLHDQKMIDFL